MRILLPFVLSAACALSACASNSSSDADKAATPAPVDEGNAAALRDATYVEGTLPVGSAITVKYERKEEYKRVPYLAVEIVGDAATQAAKPSDLQEIKVQGNFPGTPRVIVV